MIKNVFKGLIIIVGISLVIILYGIYSKLDQLKNGRFQSYNETNIIDTKTGIIYFRIGYGEFKDKNGKEFKPNL